tara:strand:+ start:454 stop:1137 length:684 start_codon:yes stop_codon:yes gene_type:complete
MKLSKHFQRLIKYTCALLIGLVCSAPSLAQQAVKAPLVVYGEALVTDGDIDKAIVRAFLDALRTAATQSKGTINSHSMVNSEGQLTESISLQSHLKVRQMKVLEQGEVQGMARVKLALTLDEHSQDCAANQLTQVMTTDLTPPPENNFYHQTDINQLLLNTEAQFSELAKSINFVTHRINPALNGYQTAWLASEAYNQADFHLTIGAQWLPSPVSKINSNEAVEKFD